MSGIIGKFVLIFIIVSMFIITLMSTNAVPLCQDVVEPNVTCNVVTPSITCTNYTYKVYNETPSLVDSGDMTLFDGNEYYFNFTQDLGSYRIRLCDNRTGDIFVKYTNVSSSTTIVNNNGGAGGTTIINQIKYDQSNASSELFTDAGVTPNSFFWGVDTWSEKLYRWIFKHSVTSRFSYDVDKFSERQQEMIKCISRKDYECAAYALEELESKKIVTTNIDKSSAEYMRLKGLVIDYQNKYFAIMTDAKAKGITADVIYDNYKYLGDLLK